MSNSTDWSGFAQIYLHHRENGFLKKKLASFKGHQGDKLHSRNMKRNSVFSQAILIFKKINKRNETEKAFKEL